jgi:hypothetical protein
MSKFHSKVALLSPQGRRLVHHFCTVAGSVAIKWFRSSSPHVVCTATASCESAQPTALWPQVVFFAILCPIVRVVPSDGTMLDWIVSPTLPPEDVYFSALLPETKPAPSPT